jgi:hypothetical protein
MLYIGYRPEVGGIGDFVYILFQYYYFLNERCGGVSDGITICIPNHPLNHCIKCVTEEPPNIPIVNIIAHSMVSADFITFYRKYKRGSGDGGSGGDALIYSNMNNFLHLCVKYAPKSKIAVLKRDFRERIFMFTPFIQNRADKLFAGAGAGASPLGAQFYAIHVRCGDAVLRGGGGGAPPQEIENKFARGVEFLRARGGGGATTPPPPVFIFTDNKNYRNYLAQAYDCFYVSTEIVHIADDAATKTAIIDTFTEFVLLSRATAIFTVVNSNFSRVAAFIFDVPIYTFAGGGGDGGNIIKCEKI